MDTKDRIKYIIENEGLNQVEFADRTGIKPPTLNHVLTGRNNASADVIQKILTAFPHYSSEWLLSGTGDILQHNMSVIGGTGSYPSTGSLFGGQEDHDPYFRTGESTNIGAPLVPNADMVTRNGTLCSSAPIPNVSAPIQATSSGFPKRSVTKIIVFYDDNTYETFMHGDEKRTK